MRHIQHLQGVLLIVGVLASGELRAQDVVVDQYGTEYAPALLPKTFLKPQVSQAEPVANAQPLLARGKGGTYLGPQKSEPSGDILVSNLTGVVLVPTPGDVVTKGVPGVRGIWHDLEDFPLKAGNVINGYLGKPVSLSSLDEMVKDVIRAYRESDRPVVDVLVPEQDITSGVVQLVVVEGRLQNIRVVGNNVTQEQAEYLQRQIRTKKGEVLRASEIMNDLSFMNRSPYRRVDLVYAPGYRFATTDIVLRTSEFDPFTAYATYENSGNRVLGRDRLIFGASWNEAFGRPGNTLSYQLTTDMDFEHIVSHSLVYTLPFRWRHYFTLMAAHVKSTARIDINGNPVKDPSDALPSPTIDISGANWQLSPRYTIPLRKAPANVAHEIVIGYDFKSLSNTLEFGGLNLTELLNTPSTAEIHQFSLGYNRTKQWDHAATRVDLTAYLSPGGVNYENDDFVFASQRSGAQSAYSYVTASLEHNQQLPAGLLGRMRVQGQMASERLLASEQLGIGGPTTVRGYGTSIARGDEGIVASGELYSPIFSPAKRFGWRYSSDELRFLVFADFASASAVRDKNYAGKDSDDPLDVGVESQSMFSLGAGLRYTFNDWLRLRLDAGLPITYDLAESEAERVEDIFWHVGATATF